jgi:hypothetical protein
MTVKKNSEVPQPNVKLKPMPWPREKNVWSEVIVLWKSLSQARQILYISVQISAYIVLLHTFLHLALRLPDTLVKILQR